MPGSHEHHGHKAQAQQHLHPFHMGYPEQRPALQQNITYGAAAKGGQTRDDTDAHGIQTFAGALNDAR